MRPLTTAYAIGRTREKSLGRRTQRPLVGLANFGFGHKAPVDIAEKRTTGAGKAHQLCQSHGAGSNTVAAATTLPIRVNAQAADL